MRQSFTPPSKYDSSLNLYPIRKEMVNNNDMSSVHKLVGNALMSAVETLKNTSKMPF